ncbi:unnamed protein product [Notodromas monacha]|uniref:Uncharacterized protein n=1 Tax=Notodromas monacha TaxID=399045 RepID=A0A7R9BWD6_9CRUS|nr:unnamed protein product [Notodromas monacha]CAG0921866.1 unnamed protein product [Notodromas monacha]
MDSAPARQSAQDPQKSCEAINSGAYLTGESIPGFEMKITDPNSSVEAAKNRMRRVLLGCGGVDGGGRDSHQRVVRKVNRQPGTSAGAAGSARLGLRLRPGAFPRAAFRSGTFLLKRISRDLAAAEPLAWKD